MLHEAVAQLRDMNQAIIFDPDVHEGAEVDYVAHRSGELHTRRQILKLQHIRAEDRRGYFLARIPAWSLQAVQDVPKRRDTYAQLRSQLCRLQLLQQLTELL
ncbi:hypothetical protein D3C73_965190 [compost metagenome]